MTRTIFTDGTMELEVGYVPATKQQEAKLLLSLEPVDKNDIALFNELVLDDFDIDSLISQLELFKHIMEQSNKEVKDLEN